MIKFLKGLSIILGLPSTASLEAMEVMSGVIPLDFRREEIAIGDIGKIYSYSAKILIKNHLDKWRRKENTDRHISPLGLSLGLLTILSSVLCLTYLDCLYFRFAIHS
jgi:hypothetical protein